MTYELYANFADIVNIYNQKHLVGNSHDLKKAFDFANKFIWISNITCHAIYKTLSTVCELLSRCLVVRLSIISRLAITFITRRICM